MNNKNFNHDEIEIECDLNCITVAWSLEQLIIDKEQTKNKRSKARKIRIWILSNSFDLDDLMNANEINLSLILYSLQTYKPSIETESIDFVARYENVVNYIKNKLK